VNDDKDYIIKLKVKNPFITLLNTFPMYGFYTIALLITIVKFDSPIINIIYFNGLLFLMFYGLAIIMSFFYIYTSLRYGDIYIYNHNRLMTENKFYDDVSIKIHRYCGRGSCSVYINFYSKEKFISRFYLEIFSHKTCEIAEDLIKKIFNSNKSTIEKKNFIKEKLEEEKKEKIQNRHLLFKGLLISFFIIVIPLIIVILNFKL